MSQIITVLPGDWLTTEQTAKAIGKHERTVQKMAKAGLLKWKLVERPGTVAGRVYDANDVKRYLPQAPPPVSTPVPHRKRPENGLATIDRKHEARIEQLDRKYEQRERESREFFDKQMRELLNRMTPKPWLTLEEASETSGLSVSYLRERIDLLEIRAVRGGPRRTWRIQRVSLDTFGASMPAPKARKAHA